MKKKLLIGALFLFSTSLFSIRQEKYTIDEYDSYVRKSALISLFSSGTALTILKEGLTPSGKIPISQKLIFNGLRGLHFVGAGFLLLHGGFCAYSAALAFQHAENLKSQKK